jgi:hypothetical protein
MFTEMTGDGTVCSFGFDSLAIGTHQNTGHQSQRAITFLKAKEEEGEEEREKKNRSL